MGSLDLFIVGSNVLRYRRETEGWHGQLGRSGVAEQRRAKLHHIVGCWERLLCTSGCGRLLLAKAGVTGRWLDGCFEALSICCGRVVVGMGNWSSALGIAASCTNVGGVFFFFPIVFAKEERKGSWLGRLLVLWCALASSVIPDWFFFSTVPQRWVSCNLTKQHNLDLKCVLWQILVEQGRAITLLDFHSFFFFKAMWC